MAQTPIINAQLDTLNSKLDALNHLISHQNAAIDLLASDKRSTLTSDIGTLAEMIHAGELLEVMDYGDKVAFAWADGNTNYAPEWKLCHIENAELEDGEEIPVGIFEWDKVLPFGTAFSPAQAIFESSSDLAAGTYCFKIVGDSWGGNNGKYVKFILDADLTAGKQIRKKSGAYNAAIESCTLGIFTSGADLTGTALEFEVVESVTGTNLGDTDGTGDLNAWARVVLGHNRWKTSPLRQYLNSDKAAGSWWTAQEKWDVKPGYADTKDGFLKGYDASIIQHMKPTKITTGRNTVTDGGGVDITIDRVFPASLEQMYIQPQLASNVGSEGAYWEYYKRLLGATSPVARSATYARLIKRDLANNTARTRWLRSAYLGSAYGEWFVNSSGGVYGDGGASGGSYCAPACKIGL